MDEYGDIDDAAFTAVADAAEKAHTTTSTTATAGQKPKVVQPVPRKIAKPSGPSSIIVSTRQKGNPLLPYIKSVPWEYGDIVADYLVSPTTCMLFLSLKYHRLHPEYIYTRIKSLGHAYTLRVLLVLADTDQHTDPLKELTKAGLIHNLTVIVAWSTAEAGRYVELYKSLEHAPATAIKERQREDYMGRVEEFVTSVKGVNKTDAVGLLSMFGSVRAAVNATEAQIGLVPGWGEKKTRRWCAAVQDDFRVGGAKGKKTAAAEGAASGTGGDGMGVKEREALNRRLGIRSKETLPKEEFDMVIDVDIDADEEEALLAAEEEERRRKAPPPVPVAGPPESIVVSRESEIEMGNQQANEDGVMAALARLRKQ